jgi:hypothetical protein
MKRAVVFLVLTVMTGCLLSNLLMAKENFVGYWEQTKTTQSTMQGQPGNQVENEIVYYKAGKMKIVNKEKNVIMILRVDLELFWHINLSQKSYTEMKFSDIETSMNNAKNAMAEQMKNMTPEQHQMMEKMMGGKTNTMPAADNGPTITFQLLNDQKTVSGVNCKKVLMLMDAKPLLTMWMTDNYSLGTEYLESYKKLGLVKGNFSDDIKKVTGFPMLSELRMDTGFGKVESSTLVTKVVTQAISDNDFALPSGLKKQATPGMNSEQ